MQFSDTELLRRIFRRLVVAKGYRSVKETTTYINFKCPHCDDTNSRKRVGRAFVTIKNRDGKWQAHYTCHNGGCEYNDPVGAIRYLKTEHPQAFEDFKRETNKSKNNFKFNIRKKFKSTQNNDWDKIEKEYIAKVKREEEEQKLKDREAMKHFIPITEPSILKNTAIKYCQNRMIPKKIWRKFFVCTKGKYRNYMIIPYFKKGEKPTYFQARALYDYVTPKYKNKVGEKQPYNIDFVDPNKPIMVFEGAIDSFFVENSFALGGVSVSEAIEDRFEKDNLYFIYDNDVAGRSQSNKMLERGYKVFNWDRFLNDLEIEPTRVKDWNALVLITENNQWKIEDVIDYFIKRKEKK